MAIPINRAAGAVTRPLRARPSFVRIGNSRNVLRDASLEPELGREDDSALAKAAPGRIDSSSFAVGGVCQLSGCMPAGFWLERRLSSRAFDLIPCELVNDLRHFLWVNRT